MKKYRYWTFSRLQDTVWYNGNEIKGMYSKLTLIKRFKNYLIKTLFGKNCVPVEDMNGTTVAWVNNNENFNLIKMSPGYLEYLKVMVYLNDQNCLDVKHTPKCGYRIYDRLKVLIAEAEGIKGLTWSYKEESEVA